MKVRYSWLILLLAWFQVSCKTYYQANHKFNLSYEAGNMEAADRILEKNKKMAKSNAKLLYFMNRGLVSSMLGNYEESNTYFERAYVLAEDYRKNPFQVAASFLVNPKLVDYQGEDHEILFINYYKALNYLYLNDPEAALVEVRRMEILLNRLSDKYSSDKKFQRDAFIHLLMGLIYDANDEYNDAFIAYRNAYEVYSEDYLDMFGLGVPEQLKEDLLRTAYLSGLRSELAFYEEAFHTDYVHKPEQGGELIMLWNNGLGPVKSEWGLNFTVVHGQNGLVTFVNESQNMSFPFMLGSNNDEDKKTTLERLEFFRVVFPRYVERQEVFTRGEILANGRHYKLEKAEDINAIAFKTLQQRMAKELSQGLLRAALKKGAEYALREEDETMGSILGIINAVTEQADTRNWQTIPHSIYYTRVPMQPGQQDVSMVLRSEKGREDVRQFTFTIKEGKTTFFSFRSLEASYSPSSYYSTAPN
ncbi:COG3014 family protein [Roseivirga sp. BDSF3-8]|uniref:COG3014 family protein n=1 Tax=Roseivirga sp. BDSF3-8 TaxID=3241598 RepID=UPI003531CB96